MRKSTTCTALILLCVLLISALGILSCTLTPKKKPPMPSEPSARVELQKAQGEANQGRDQSALAIIKRLLAKHPGTDVADEGLMLAGRIHYRRQDFSMAYEAFIAIVNSDFFSPNEANALLWASRSLLRLGRLDEALSLTERSVKIPGISDQHRVESYRLRYSILNELNDRLDSLSTGIWLAENDPEQKESYRVRAIDVVESRLNEDELRTVSNSSQFGFAQAFASLRLGVLYFEQKDFSRARSQFHLTQKLMPNTDLFDRAQSYLSQIEARRRVDAKAVGAVLPLTGRHSVVAQRTLRGLQLGLGIYGPQTSDLKLAIVDSEGNPDTARRGVERLVTEDYVVGMVGSLLSRTALPVATKAEELGVPSIALSQRSGLTEIGPTVFRNALTSEIQVRHLVHVAMSDLGLKKFAILFPNDPYGVEYANLFWDEVLSRGGEIVGAQTYEPNETDFSGPIRRLVGTYYYEDRQSEYKNVVRDWFKRQRSIRTRNAPPDNLLPPLVEFEALFIPDNLRALGQIAPMLAYLGVQDIRLLGTNIWNSPEIVRRGERHVEKALFVDALVHDSTASQNDFVKLYRQTFEQDPGLFEMQGFEAGVLIRQALRRSDGSRSGLAQALSRFKQFHTGLHPLVLNSKREWVRPLATLTVDGGQIKNFYDVQTPQKSAPPKTRRINR